jgi:choline dehydrogenase-like flavoprotein
MIPEAEATGRCEVRSDSYVFRLETDARGLATGVHYFGPDKREQFQSARAVVVSAHLMFNQNSAVHAVFEQELNEYKSVQVTRVIHDFYDSDPQRGFYGGGGIDGRIGRQPIGWALASGGNLPGWGPALKERLQAFSRSMVCAGHSTSLPLETNSVSLDPDVKDAWGIPAIRVTYRDHPDDLAMSRFLRDRSIEIMHAAGAQKIWIENVAERTSSVHLLGTCRMGHDETTSVIDKSHRTHDVPNLFLCDGSSFVTSGRGQPTMTIQALAFRAADEMTRLARRNEITPPVTSRRSTARLA